MIKFKKKLKLLSKIEKYSQAYSLTKIILLTDKYQKAIHLSIISYIKTLFGVVCWEGNKRKEIKTYICLGI